MRLINNDSTEFAYLKKDRKTVEELEEQEIPQYNEKRGISQVCATHEKPLILGEKC